MIENNEKFDDNSIPPFVIKHFFALRELRKNQLVDPKKSRKIFRKFLEKPPPSASRKS